MYQTPTFPAAPTGFCLAEMTTTLRLATPLALIALVNMGMSITDTLMAASFGVEALAAVAVASDAYSILFYLAAGTLGGIAPLWAQMRAAGDHAALARLGAAGWRVAALLAGLGAPALWFAPHYLGWVGIDEGLLATGQGYARAMAVSFVPMLGVVLYRQQLTAEARPGIFLKVVLAALPLNAVLDLVFMHGIGPWQGLGVTGAGVASACVALAMLMALRHAASRGGTGARATRSADWPTVSLILRKGLPIGIATVAEVGIFLGATLAIATLGAAEVAAHAIAIRVAGVIYAVPVALQQAATVRMGNAEGLGCSQQRLQVMATGLTLGLVAGLGLFGLVGGIANPLAGAVLVDDPAARGIAVTLLLLLAATQLVEPLGAIATGILRGRCDTRAPMTIVLVTYWAVSAPLGLWLMAPMGMGAVGVWIGLAAGTVVTAIATCARLRRHWPGTV